MRTRPLVTRLMGMETEYATLCADPQKIDSDELPPSGFVYDQICEAIRRDQPTAKGLFDNEQLFLANGGAVSFESHPLMHTQPGGLIEVATPEVRSPEELLACQRSIDQLVADATADSETSFDIRVLKNSSDALGHIYGCQENYEAVVASGIWLVVYRSFILLLWMMQVASLLLSLPLLWGMLTISYLSRIWQRKDRVRDRESEETVDWDADADLSYESGLDATFESVPPWLTLAFVQVLRLIHFPAVILLRVVAKHIAFRPQRRYLIAYFASRPSICGAGNLDHAGRFRLSAKAMAIDCIADMGGFRGERPVFVFGHWLNQFCAKSFISLSSTAKMFSRVQRLQIGLSDSNMSDHAEYVKFASTSLLLDMIEAGEVSELPVLKQSVASIHRIGSDWNMISRVPTNRGELSALEIQRMYLAAAKAFVAQTPVPWLGESLTVITRWESLIDCVNAFRHDQDPQHLLQSHSAIGRIDWLTKHWVMESLEAAESGEVSWSDKKKIDLRYHELSPDGYYYQLLEARPDVILVDQDLVQRRRRSPPAGSPAAKRGWMIREFSGSEEAIQTEWTHAMIGRGRKRRRVNF
ncbi:Depupylase [Novipirellula aureliae]|uniref:Depupylase n=1 Tax=Novipirellula aureliae TaxID=2527966 RepID=A0A5C6E7W7_9BACT|nr:proteasome accessory factor PafA2 family protein [Novipirellula aureliae]TWU44908.1 Depupylase [Novipirellula aureliae]